MAPSKAKHSPEGLLSSPRLFVIRFFTVIAIALASYLLWVSLGGLSIGCGPESNCDKVLHSRWAYWFGVPVSAVALAVYVAMFVGTLRLGRDVPVAQQRRAWAVLIPGAITVIGAAVWFTGLQLFRIKVLCPFCMGAHAAGFVAATVVLLSAPFRHPPEKPWQAEKQVFVPFLLARKLSLAAVAGLALLVAGQALHQPKTFALTTVPTNIVAQTLAQTSAPSSLLASTEPPTSAPPTAAAAIKSNVEPPTLSSVATSAQHPSIPAVQSKPGTNGIFQIYGGLFSFDLRELPVIGDAAAPYKIVSLFDYTCHHCRIMHAHLMEAHKTLSNKLAIVSLPMPLDSACNGTVRQTPSAHSNACEYARIGLAVWRANRQAHGQFDDWIFASETPPPLPQARDYAMQLAGKAAFGQALHERWIDEQIQHSIAIYSTNLIHLGNGAMPQLIIGNKLASGTLTGVQELYQLLAENLGLKPGS
jgi:uncharacterized membrane protein